MHTLSNTRAVLGTFSTRHSHMTRTSPTAIVTLGHNHRNTKSNKSAFPLVVRVQGQWCQGVTE